MKFSIEDMLNLMADMQAFTDSEDELSVLISEHETDELSGEELELVSAAQGMNYQYFLQKLEK